MAFVSSSTVLGSTVAFAVFVGANNFLFGQGEAIPVELLGEVVFQHIAAAYTASQLVLPVPLEGLGTARASQLYYYVLLWSIPVVIQQVRWVYFTLPRKWAEKTEDLQAIANATDEALGNQLDEHFARREASADLSDVWARIRRAIEGGLISRERAIFSRA